MNLASHKSPDKTSFQEKLSVQEKRDFIRMKVDTGVTVKLAASDSVLNGRCRDLSGGGMLIEIPRSIPVGSTVEVSLESSHGHNPMLRANAEVRRIDKHLTLCENPCIAGLKILEMI